MDFLGIGPLELLLILLIALILLGPNDMVKAGRTIGRAMRKIITSPTWQEIRKIRYLPNKLMREAGIEENEWNISSEIQKASKDISTWITPPTLLDSPPPPALKGSQHTEKTILPTSSPWFAPAEQEMQKIAPQSPQKDEIDSNP